MDNKPRFITCDGAVWRLTASAYRRLVRDIAKGVLPDLDTYGTCLGLTETLDGLMAR